MVPETPPLMAYGPQQPLKTSTANLTVQDLEKVRSSETALQKGGGRVRLSSLPLQVSGLPCEEGARDSWQPAWFCGQEKA